MKKVILFITLISFQLTFSQEEKASVEKSLFGVQTGLLGVWIHNETRISNSFSLRSEVGLDAGIFSASSVGSGFLLTPVVALEPRWYYNLEKRNVNGKLIAKNSANFLTTKIAMNPDWFLISNDNNNIDVIRQFVIIPKWGIKRTVSNHLTYELGVGLGYAFYLDDFKNKNGDIALDLHLRIGYTF